MADRSNPTPLTDEEMKLYHEVQDLITDLHECSETSKGCDLQWVRTEDNKVYFLCIDDVRGNAKIFKEYRDKLLFDLDEIDNKPWRVFRQLSKIMPEYAETYYRYEAFYSYGGSKEVMKLIEEFEKTDDFKESGFPEMIEKAKNQ